MITIRKRIPIKVGLAQVDAEILSFTGIQSGHEHIALIFTRNEISQDSALVRVHSECLTGDIFHSSRCDCGEQLDEAIDLLDKSGGVLLYMRQEGRGIGLYNKLDAYALQDTGLNTYEANIKLGFEKEERNFSEAAGMLKALGLYKIRLLTNNPYKVKNLEDNGIKVGSIVNTRLHIKHDNASYLRTKMDHGDHQLALI